MGFQLHCPLFNYAINTAHTDLLVLIAWKMHNNLEISENY